MARDDAAADERDLSGLLGAIVRETETLVGEHVALLRSELREGLREGPPAALMIGAGAGLVATGGVLGSLMVVHGLHRATRLPLWGCYGLVGGLLTSLGAGLLAAGGRRVSGLSFVPRETIATLREDMEWLRDQATSATS